MIAGIWLRLLLAVTGTAVTVTTLDQASGDLATPVTFLAVVLVTWVVARPGSASAAVLICGALLLQLVNHGTEVDAAVFALIVLLPLLHVGAALAAVLPATGSVEWAALRPSVMRYAAAVGVTCAVAVLVRLTVA